jgi:hypothetical protein
MAEGERDSRALGTRLLWFVALWFAGIVAVGAMALIIRSVLL